MIPLVSGFADVMQTMRDRIVEPNDDDILRVILRSMSRRHRTPEGLVDELISADQRYRLRLPLLSDAGSWRRTCLAERTRLTAAFGRDDMSWDEAHSPIMWTERCVELRRAYRKGRALPFVVCKSGRAGVEEIVGEVGVSGVDRWTDTAELYVWLAKLPNGRAVSSWALASVTLRAFESGLHPARVVGPIAVANPRAAHLAERVGFEPKAVRRDLRLYDGVPTDHRLWVMENTVSNVDKLRKVVARER